MQESGTDETYKRATLFNLYLHALLPVLRNLRIKMVAYAQKLTIMMITDAPVLELA